MPQCLIAESIKCLRQRDYIQHQKEVHDPGLHYAMGHKQSKGIIGTQKNQTLKAEKGKDQKLRDSANLFFAIVESNIINCHQSKVGRPGKRIGSQ